MEANHLWLHIPAAPVDEDVIADILHPLKALQQRYILLDKHSSHLLHHCHHYQILDNLLQILKIPTCTLSSPNRFIELPRSISHQVLTIIIFLEQVGGEIRGSSQTNVVVDGQ